MSRVGDSGEGGLRDTVFHSAAQQGLKELQGIVGELEDVMGKGCLASCVGNGYNNSTHLKKVIVRSWSGIIYANCLVK